MKKKNDLKPTNIIKLKKVELGKPKNVITFAKLKERVDKKND